MQLLQIETTMLSTQADNDKFTRTNEYLNFFDYDTYGYSLACSLGSGSSSSIIVNIRGLTFEDETPNLKLNL